MMSLKSRLSSFPLIRICRNSAFLIAKASKGAASSLKMPTGCRILAREYISSNTTARRRGSFNVWRDFSSPAKAGSAGGAQPAKTTMVSHGAKEKS